jgi:hypothetical protein
LRARLRGGAEEFVDAIGVESDDDLIANDDGGSHTAVVGTDQFEYGTLVAADVAVFEIDTSAREVGLKGAARRSAGLGENNHLLHTEI